MAGGGASETVTVLVVVPVSPSSSVTVSRTWYVPFANGWSTTGSVAVVPSPKSQAYAVMVPSLSVEEPASKEQSSC